MKNIDNVLKENIKNRADLPYIYVRENGSFKMRTFGEVVNDVRNLARGLLCQNAGENVMLFSENSYEWLITYLAVPAYVGVIVPIDCMWTSFDIKNTLSVIKIDAVMYSKSRHGVIEELQKEFPNIRFLCIEESFAKLMEIGKNSKKVLAPRAAELTSAILFTSGTTSRPKAIPFTQNNLFYNCDAVLRRTPMSMADISYIFLPLNHVYSGVANFLYSLVSGMRICLCSDHSKMIEEMLEIRPTVVCTVPLILKRIRDHMTDEVMEMLRNIRFLYCGGAFTEPDLKRYFIENGIKFMEAYGTTETTSVISLQRPEDDNMGCNGTILDGLDVRIINADESGVGEIIVGGGSVSSGYIGGGDGGEFDDKGFYHTGDLGHIDGEKRLFLQGRKKRVIITANGKNIYIDELESLILENPDIHAATVFEEEHRPAVKLYTEISETKACEFINTLNEKLPGYKKIKNLYIQSGGRLK